MTDTDGTEDFNPPSLIYPGLNLTGQEIESRSMGNGNCTWICGKN